MYLGYLSFAEIEIVNEQRLRAYATAMDVLYTCPPECETLRTSLEHAAYTTPAADLAPWYDSALPESGDVAGFRLLEITGMGSPLARPFTATGTGVSIGTISPAPRQMVLRFEALSKDKCASDYAVQWLLKTLAGLNCNEPFYPDLPNRPCGGDDMCFFSCCPTAPADVAARLMTMFKVGLTGSTVIREYEIVPGCAGHACEIEVTLASDPYIWRTPNVAFTDTVEDMTFLGSGELAFPGGCTVAECAVPLPPGCDPITPIITQFPPAPCVGGEPFGDRQVLTMNHYQAFMDMTLVSKKLLSAPIIRWQPVPGVDTDVPIMFGFSRSACGNNDPCEVESIYFIPAYFTSEGFVIDTRLSAAYQTPDGCPLLVTDFELAPVGWDRLACAESMCLHVWIDERTDSRAGTVTVEFATEFTAVC